MMMAMVSCFLPAIHFSYPQNDPIQSSFGALQVKDLH